MYATIHIPSLNTVDPLGPRAYPYLVAAGLIGSAIWMAIESFQSRKTTVQSSDESSDETQNKSSGSYWMLAGVVAWLSIYYAIIESLGFVASTILFLIGLTAYFNPNKWKTNILVSLIISIGIYVLFTRVLGVPLAKGLLDI